MKGLEGVGLVIQKMGRSNPLIVLCFLLLPGYLINADFIDDTCRGTPNYQLCVHILRSDPRSSGADTRILALIMVDNGLKNKVKETVKKIKELKERQPGLGPPLDRCGEVYHTVLTADIPSAIEALQTGAFKFAENGVADAAVESQVCEAVFKRSKSNGSPLFDYNNSVKAISDVARQIIRKLL